MKPRYITLTENFNEEYTLDFKYKRVKREILACNLQLCFLEFITYEPNWGGGGFFSDKAQISGFRLVVSVDERMKWIQDNYIGKGFQWKEGYKSIGEIYTSD